MPTGSGSADARDIIDTDFQRTIIHAMERELQEESMANKDQSHDFQTMILGFYRWVSRGGKPEFVGITKLPESADTYKPNNKEVSQLGLSTEFIVANMSDLPKVITHIKRSDNISVPLFMCLNQLEYMYNHHKKELEEFLFS